MKILVTGGLGFIGHNVVHLLEQQGHDVAIVDTQTTYGIVDRRDLDVLIAERMQKIRTRRIYYIDVSAREMQQVFAAYQPDMVVHLASFPRQKVVNSNPMLGSRAMSEGLLNLLEASVRHQVQKFVYVSSSMVYGDFNHKRAKGIDESHPNNPKGQYGIMKLSGEWLVKDYTERTGMQHVIIRPSAVYGPRDVEDRVVSKFLLGAMRGHTITVNGSKESLDFTYVDDAAQGIATATLTPTVYNTTYNITRGQGRTLLEAAELAVSIAGQGAIQINDPDNNFPSRGQLNITKAHNDFGYRPQVSIEQGFLKYYEWLKNSVYGIKKTI
jgi:nucleoside-diphosphate-sugar epimerase